MHLYFQLENISRLFEIMKMIFKKCIRIVKRTSDLTSAMYAGFVISRYTVIPIKWI